MVVWQSAEGEPTDIQRLDIWSPHQGLSQPLSHVLASVVCVCVCVRGDAHKKNIYSVIFFLYTCLITHWKRETENWKRNTGSEGVHRGEREREAG